MKEFIRILILAVSIMTVIPMIALLVEHIISQSDSILNKLLNH